jgi:hypothetical protein
MCKDPQRHTVRPTPHAAAAAVVDLFGSRPNPIETVYFGQPKCYPLGQQRIMAIMPALTCPLSGCRHPMHLEHMSRPLTFTNLATELSVHIVSTKSIHSHRSPSLDSAMKGLWRSRISRLRDANPSQVILQPER